MSDEEGGKEAGIATYRPVSSGDLDLICRHRHEMFKASGRTDAIVQPSTDAFRPWLRPRLDDGSYFGWIACLDEIEVAGLGMMVIDWPPHPSHPLQPRRGYILNVFVEPRGRGRGLAHALMDMAMAESKRRNLEYLILHATAMAMPMYEKFGWRRTSEMAMTLPVQP
jgi:ribosomal protein S18 acetylase RimI-like enzyme